MARLEKDWAERLRIQRKMGESRAVGRRLANKEQRGRLRKHEGLEPGGDTGDNSWEEETKVPEEDCDNTTIDEEEFDRKEASLFVYVCTHSAEITKGKGVAGSYLVASDTSWKSKEELARTAISLEAFAGAIARIQVTTPVQVVILRVFYPRQ